MDTEFSILHAELDNTWSDEALCKGLTEVFFGPAAERPERRVEREALAKSFCLECPAMLPCRRSGRLNREHGIWGAETDEERAAAGYAPRSPSRRAVIQARDTSAVGGAARRTPVTVLAAALRATEVVAEEAVLEGIPADA